MLKQKLIGIVFSFLLVMMSQILFAQNVSGKVTDTRDGEPLTGVSVLEVGTTNGTVTDIDGTYSLKLNSPSTVLVFSYIGYTTKSISVNGQSELNVVMEFGTLLDEVIVTSLGISREKKSLSYSAQGVSSSEMKQARSTNILNTLSGKVAGISVMALVKV